MSFKNFVLVKQDKSHYRPVVGVSYETRTVRLGAMDDEGLSFSLEEAQSLTRMLNLFGYSALVWSRKD